MLSLDRACVSDRRLVIGPGPVFAHRIAGDHVRPLGQFVDLEVPTEPMHAAGVNQSARDKNSRFGEEA
jgi:hypothetical protein